MAQPGKREHNRAVDTLRRRSEQGMATIFEHAVSEDGHIALLKNSCVSTHMRDFSVTVKTDKFAQDVERDQVRAAVGQVVKAFNFQSDRCGVTGTEVHNIHI